MIYSFQIDNKCVYCSWNNCIVWQNRMILSSFVVNYLNQKQNVSYLTASPFTLPKKKKELGKTKDRINVYILLLRIWFITIYNPASRISLFFNDYINAYIYTYTSIIYFWFIYRMQNLPESIYKLNWNFLYYSRIQILRWLVIFQMCISVYVSYFFNG